MDHLKQLKEKFEHERDVVCDIVIGCKLSNALYLRVLREYEDACEAFRQRQGLRRLRCRPTLDEILDYIKIYRIELKND